MKKVFGMTPLIAVLGLGVLLGGCGSLPASQTNTVEESPVKTLTGKVVVAGNVIELNNNGIMTQITSRTIDLTKYIGQTVSVTGQFSGTTLYVDELK